MHAHLARGAAEVSGKRTCVRFAPRKGHDFDLLFVAFLQALTVYAINLQEIVYLCHSLPPVCIELRANTQTSAKLSPGPWVIPPPGAARPTTRRVGSAAA